MLDGQEERLSQQRQNAARYSSELQRYDAFRLPATPEDRLPVYSSYVLGLTRYARTTADDLHKLLTEAAIETRRIVLPTGERDLLELPVADQARSSSLLLPVHTDLDPDEAEHILDCIFSYAIG